MARQQQSFTLKAHPFEVSVRFHLTRESFKRAVKDPETKKILDSEDHEGLTYRQEDVVHIGIFTLGLNVLIHELTHAVIDIFDGIEMPINLVTQEPVAYLMGSLAEKAWNRIETMRNKQRDEMDCNLPSAIAAGTSAGQGIQTGI